MKSPLIYLTAVKLKNQIKDFVKKPAKLIYVLFLAAMLGLVAFSGNVQGGELYPERPLSDLVAILVLFYTLMFLMVFLAGSASSTPMFTLSDVTLLFPSPLSPNKILFYGLCRQLGISLLLGFFLLFQYSWLHGLFGLSYGGLLLIVAGYGLVLFLAQLCAMAVYARTSGNERAQKLVKRGAIVLTAAYLLCAVLACKEQLTAVFFRGEGYSSALTALSDFFSTLPGLLFPVSGWAAAMVGGLLQGNLTFVLLFLALTAALVVVLILLIVMNKADYYEDVLQTAETAQSAVTAKKEGMLQEGTPKHVKVGKIGLNKGWGASAIYYKHKVENRRSGAFFLSNISLLFVVIIIVASVGLRFMEEASLVAVFAMATYMQLFSTALGRFNKELTKPYLYLIPEPPLKKMLYALKERLLTDSMEALLIFLPVSLILGLSPLDCVLCILGRLSFALLFTAGNIVVERIFGTFSSKVLIFFFYFLVLILMMLPGILLGVLLMALLPMLPEILSVFAGIIAGNVVLALLALFLCRNLLQYAELNNQ